MFEPCSLFKVHTALILLINLNDRVKVSTHFQTTLAVARETSIKVAKILQNSQKKRPNFTIPCTRIAKLIPISLFCDVTGALDLCKVAMKTQKSQAYFTCYFRYLAQLVNIYPVYLYSVT